MPLLKRYTNWRTTWTQIVPGRFGGVGPFSDLLFYDQNAGVAEIYSTDGQGNITLMNSYGDWDTEWDLIVPGNFGGTPQTQQTDLLLYSRARGAAAFFDVSGRGNITLMNSYSDWDTDWDLIIPGNFGGTAMTQQTDILLYSRARGAAAFFDVSGHGNITLMNSYDDWDTDWDLIIPGNFGGTAQTQQTDLLLYSYGGGAIGFNDVWGAGNVNLMRSYDAGSLNYDIIVPGHFRRTGQPTTTDLFFYRQDRGTAVFYRVRANGIISHIRSFDGWDRNWSKIIPGIFAGDGNVTDLLFYDSVSGIGEFYVGYDLPQSIAAENAHPGTESWKLVSSARSHQIEGYASATSVDRGNQIIFYVNTEAPTYDIDIFRMGFYQGFGGCLVTSIGNLSGNSQLNRRCIDELGMIECQWEPSYSFKIPDAWHSGVFLAKLTSAAYVDGQGANISSYDQYIIFVVRDDLSISDVMFQSSVTTYQAYNLWGGTSLYGDFKDPAGIDHNNQAHGVSFNRPYLFGNGCSDFLYWEYPMLRWLESNGFDLTYCTDIDTDVRGELLLNHKVFLSVGHDEYWSLRMRNTVETALTQGISLAFFGANAMYWQVRLYGSAFDAAADAAAANAVLAAAAAGAPPAAVSAAAGALVSYGTSLEDGLSAEPRIVVSYKELAAADPLGGVENKRVTTNWRNDPVARPEDAIIGQMWESWYDTGNFPWVAINTDLWPFEGTGINDGDSFPGIVGYEYDLVYDGTEADPPPHTAFPAPAGLLKLAQSSVTNDSDTPSHSNTTLYTAPSGAMVFAAGTISWSWGLDDETLDFVDSWNNHQYSSPALQRLTLNVLNRFISL